MSKEKKKKHQPATRSGQIEATKQGSSDAPKTLKQLRRRWSRTQERAQYTGGRAVSQPDLDRVDSRERGELRDIVDDTN